MKEFRAFLKRDYVSEKKRERALPKESPSQVRKDFNFNANWFWGLSGVRGTKGTGGESEGNVI